jgi:transposase
VLGVEAWTTIRYLQAQGVGIRAICRQLGVSRTAVRHALRSDEPPHYQRPQRPNYQLVPYEAQIHAWYFGQHLIGSRILRELRKLGYTGGITALYAYLKQLRAAAPSGKATIRFETPPGRQGQFDWSPYTLELGGELTKVIVFGMTLGYSRRKHYTVSLDETQASIFEAIEACLHHFGGAPKELLVDNARALVTDANPTNFRWNPQFLELCGHYRVQPRACRPYRAQTKGKIERPFFYLEEQFIKGGSFASLLDLHYQLARFEADDLDVYVHATTQERAIDRFQAEISPPDVVAGAAFRWHTGALAQGELGLPGLLPRQPLLGASGVRRQTGVADGLARHAPADTRWPAANRRRARAESAPRHYSPHPGALRHVAAHIGAHDGGAGRAIPGALSSPACVPGRSDRPAQAESGRSSSPDPRARRCV